LLPYHSLFVTATCEASRGAYQIIGGGGEKELRQRSNPQGGRRPSDGTAREAK
jgi:hypothetical protein